MRHTLAVFLRLLTHLRLQENTYLTTFYLLQIRYFSSFFIFLNKDKADRFIFVLQQLQFRSTILD